MEIFLIIGLVLIVLALWGIRGVLTNIQNTLLSIDSNLDSLNDRFNPPEHNPYE